MKVIILTGPSGSGKTTLYKKAISHLKNIKKVITTTTREKRGNEKNNKDYHFISKKEIEEKISKKEFIEYEEVYGNYYGSSKEELSSIYKEGKVPIYIVDVKGAKTLKKLFPESLLIFISPPSIEILEKRLKKRNTETDETIRKRLSKANDEMDFSSQADKIILNDNLDKAVKEFIKIISNYK